MQDAYMGNAGGLRNFRWAGTGSGHCRYSIFLSVTRGEKKKLAGMEQGGKYNIVESNAFSFSLSFWSGAFGMNFISRRSAMNVHEAMHVTRLLFLIEFQEVRPLCTG